MNDIDVPNKKLDRIEENSHKNDEEITKKTNTYPTVDETNAALDVLKGKIETLEAENTSLKTMIAAFEARIAALEEKNIEWSSFYTGFIDEYQDANNLKYSYYANDKQKYIAN